VETHGKSYLNPFYREITDWMDANGYERWWLNRTDTVYYRRGGFSVSSAEKLRLTLMDLYVKFRRGRKRVERFFRGGGRKGTKA